MPVFAFTDIEGSTGLWEKHTDAMGPVIARHYAILDSVIPAHGGRIVKKTGDGVFAIFPDDPEGQACAALECALDLQRHFQAEVFPVVGELRVRMGFHCGQAEEMAGDFYGPTANRTARFMSLGWGGQILVSEDLRKQARLPQGGEWLDLGVHQIKDLPEPQHVFSLAHPDLKQREFPPLKSLSDRPHNLPPQLSPFVGRAKELKDIAPLLAGAHSRLITLLGAGGAGKSRLAVKAALDNLPQFKNGAWLVGLEGLASPDQFIVRVAEALKLGLYRQKNPKEQLLDYLKDKNLLLILDPCEGLGAGAGLILEFLEACPGLKVWACSRRRLNLRGETVMEVRGLDYPANAAAEGFAESGCVRLFTQQVQGGKPGYSLKTEDRPFFLRICRALQGLPLGLELAAGQALSIPLKALAENLEKDPGFLSSTRADLPQRHRGLKALFESTWVLLPDAEKQAYAQLSVFRGGFTLGQAQGMFRVAPGTLGQLADFCLLEAGPNGRRFIPELARFFAAAKLKENPVKNAEALDLQARHFCKYVKERERGLSGFDQARALLETRAEFPNIQRAWDHAVSGGLAREIALAAHAVGLFTDMQGLARDWEPRAAAALKLWEGTLSRAPEGLAWEDLLSAHGTLMANHANYLFSLGRDAEALDKMGKSLAFFRKAGNRPLLAYGLVRLAIFQGPEDERRAPLLEEAVALYQSLSDSNGAAWARRNLGYLLCWQGRLKEGKPMIEESLAVFREVKNVRETAWSLSSLGTLALESGQTQAGEEGLREARDLFLSIGDLESAAWALSAQGMASVKQKAWAEAKVPVEESMMLFRQIRHFRGWAQSLRDLCEIHAGMGDLPTAFKAVDQVIAEARSGGNLVELAGALIQKGRLLARQNKFDEAVGMMEEGRSHFAKAGAAQGEASALESQACVRLRQGRPVLARGLFQQSAEAFSKALACEGEARLYVRLGDLDSAESAVDLGEDSYKKALKLSRQIKPGDYTLGALRGLAAQLHKQGRTLDALSLALLCERCLELRMMPASEAEFYEEVGQKNVSLLASLGSKLMRSVIEETRLRLKGEDARAMLKEYIEKYGS